MNQTLQDRALPTKPKRRYFQTAPSHCYTGAEVCRLLKLSRRTFFDLKRRGQLPLVELQPRLGRVIRYHAAPIDRYLSGGR